MGWKVLKYTHYLDMSCWSMLTHRERIPQGCSRQSKQTPAHEFFLPGHHLDRKHRQKIMIYFQVSIHDPISRGFPFWKSFGIFWLIEVEEGPRKYAITISKCFKSFRPTSFTASLSYKMFPAPNKIIPTPKQKNSPPPPKKKKSLRASLLFFYHNYCLLSN